MSNSNDEIPVGKLFLVIIAIVVFGLAIGWFAAGNDFFMYKYFAPKQEEVRRDVYEHTKSYHQGNIQRLANLCSQVTDPNTPDDHKGMINDTIQHEFAEWDLNDVPGYLQSCLLTARK